MTQQLTINDALTLVHDQAQWCREEGEADMRYITQMTDGIMEAIKSGKTREEIMERYDRNEETEA